MHCSHHCCWRSGLLLLLHRRGVVQSERGYNPGHYCWVLRGEVGLVHCWRSDLFLTLYC